MLSEENVGRALHETRRRLAGAGGKSVPPPSDSEIAAALQSLGLNWSDESQTSSARQFDVTYFGSSPNEATLFVDQIAAQFIEWQRRILESAAAEPKVDPQALLRLAERREREAAAKNKLQAFLQRHFGDIHDIAAIVDKTPAAAPKENPVWLRLHDEWSTLSQRRAQLLADRTEQHPAIQDLNFRIQQLEQQLQQVPRLAESSGVSEPAARTDTSGTRRSQINVHLLAQRLAASTGQFSTALQKDIESYRAIAAEYEDARFALDQAERTVEAARQAPVTPVSAQIANVVQPGQVVKRVGGSSPARIGLIALLSLAAGIGMAWLARRLPANNVLISAEQAEQALSLPVVGAIATGSDAPAVSPIVRRTRLVRGVTVAGEVILAVVVMLFVAVALFDSPVLKHFAHDPLGAASETVARVARLRF